MTHLDHLRSHEVDLWLVNQKQDVALHNVSKSLTQYAVENKPAIIEELLAEEDAHRENSLLTYHSEPIPEDPNWFVAMTTSPRRHCTLLRSLAEVRAAGWEPIVFSEPDSTETNAETIHNDVQQGAWHNWKQACIFAMESDAPYILLLQDDVSLHQDSKLVVEGLLPSHGDGLLSLYTPKRYGYKKPPGVFQVQTKSLWGAVAMAYPRQVLAELLMCKTSATWLGASIRSKSKQDEVFELRRNEPWRIANIDTAIGKGMNEIGRPMYFINPSPATHSSEYSTLDHGGNTGNRQAFPVADRDIPLEWQIETPSYATARSIKRAKHTYPPIDQVMVTSLSSKRIEHQQNCLKAWGRLGVTNVIAVQLEDEVRHLEDHFPDVRFKIVDKGHEKFGLPLINDIVGISKELNQPIILCNSDIEPYCTQEYFLDNWVNVPEKTLQWGQRYDYEGVLNVTGRCDGIDLFRITPDMEIDGGDELCIGMVAWDYWLPHVLHEQGYVMRTDYQPTFFHMNHSGRHWNLRIYYPQATKVAGLRGLKRTELEGFAQREKIYSELRAKERWGAEKKSAVSLQRLPEPEEKSDTRPLFTRDQLNLLDTEVAPELEIITCLYNVTDQMKDNYSRWLSFLGKMADNVSCYEMLFEGEHQKIPDSIIVPATKYNKLWQQEALINIGIERAKKPYVAWVDPDILFEDPFWAQDAVEMLKEKSAVQLYSNLSYLDKWGHLERDRVGAVKAWGRHKSRVGCTGGAWAARRDVMMEMGGLFSRMPVGGGDSMFMSLINDDRTFYYYSGWEARDRYKQWKLESREFLNESNVGYLDVRGFHLWHMTDTQRQYENREHVLSGARFDPYVDLKIDDGGLLRWSSHKPDLHQAVEYFFHVREQQ